LFPRLKRFTFAVLYCYGDYVMRKEYDFSKAQKNPYARRLKRQVTIRFGPDCSASLAMTAFFKL
jgi:hypothetical protein